MMSAHAQHYTAERACRARRRLGACAGLNRKSARIKGLGHSELNMASQLKQAVVALGRRTGR
jgi:hypothetical protein